MLVYNGEFDLLSRRLAVIACPKFFSFFFSVPQKDSLALSRGKTLNFIT